MCAYGLVPTEVSFASETTENRRSPGGYSSSAASARGVGPVFPTSRPFPKTRDERGRRKRKARESVKKNMPGLMGILLHPEKERDLVIMVMMMTTCNSKPYSKLIIRGLKLTVSPKVKILTDKTDVA